MASTSGYALSPIQRHLWALAQSGPAGSLAYNISINLRVHGPLDRGLVRAAIAGHLGFAYFVVDNASLAMGNFGVDQPLIAAWAPFLLFAMIGEAVLVRTEE